MTTTFITENLPDRYTIRVHTYDNGLSDYFPQYAIPNYRGDGRNEWFGMPDSKHRLARKSEQAARQAIARHAAK